MPRRVRRADRSCPRRVGCNCRARALVRSVPRRTRRCQRMKPRENRAFPGRLRRAATVAALVKHRAAVWGESHRRGETPHLERAHDPCRNMGNCAILWPAMGVAIPRNTLFAFSKWPQSQTARLHERPTALLLRSRKEDAPGFRYFSASFAVCLHGWCWRALKVHPSIASPFGYSTRLLPRRYSQCQPIIAFIARHCWQWLPLAAPLVSCSHGGAGEVPFCSCL
jgi:hypothetical protein